MKTETGQDWCTKRKRLGEWCTGGKKISEVLINTILQRTKYHTGQLEQQGMYVSHPSDLHTGHVDGRMNRWMDYTHMGTQLTPHSGDPIKLQITQ